jgi:hypothetical protein
MAEQLDRLYNLVGQKRIELDIIPFTVQLRRTPAHGFWIYDRRLVIVETISEEPWLTGDEDVELYDRPGTGSRKRLSTGRRPGG